MKVLKTAAWGLVLAVCLGSAVPAASADDTWTPRRSAGAGPAGWVIDILAELARCFGVEQDAPTPVTAAEAGSGCHIDPNGNRICGPLPTADDGCHIDPNGAPVCQP
jgi:hypothetical protein